MDRLLETPRLHLREPRITDAPQVFCRWAGDAALLRYLQWKPHTEIEQTRQMLAWEGARRFKRTGYTWLLVERGSQAPIGQIQLVAQTSQGTAHHLRLGYVLARSHQGRGLMREAVEAVVAHAFAQAAVWRIDALCDVENDASARLLRRAGFEREGRLARHTPDLHTPGPPRDVWLFARIRMSHAPQPCTATITA